MCQSPLIWDDRVGSLLIPFIRCTRRGSCDNKPSKKGSWKHSQDCSREVSKKGSKNQDMFDHDKGQTSAISVSLPNRIVSGITWSRSKV